MARRAGSCSRCRGQLQPKPAAFPKFGLDPDCATHPLGGFADDRETDASARVAGVGIKTLKNPEDAALRFFWYADAVVFKPQADAAVRIGMMEWRMYRWGFNQFSADGDVGMSARRNEFDGVVEIVGNALGKVSLVPQDAVEWAFDPDICFRGL